MQTNSNFVRTKKFLENKSQRDKKRDKQSSREKIKRQRRNSIRYQGNI